MNAGHLRQQMHSPTDKLKIVVADDSPFFRRLVEDALAREDYTLLFAKNGREAIDFVTADEPAVVITDWEMPDFTGLELCQKIRGAKHPYTYIILLTSNKHKEQIVCGLDAGADDYLTKPFDPRELLARIRVGRRIAELHREVQAKNKMLEELALTDALTGLPNRRGVEHWVARELSAADRYGFPLWVVMADLDRFKKINDTHGHETGDRVLKEFAAILKANTRASNMCGRLGGEEFVAVIGHSDRAGALIAIERVRQELEAHAFTMDGATIRVTASFGIAGLEGRKTTEFAQLLREADAALYAAKAHGRNRIAFAEAHSTAQVGRSEAVAENSGIFAGLNGED
jgi:two-component system, cell cycle response regulator